MRHFVYKTTNNINGKFYIGVKSCSCDFLSSNYYGSGTALKSAIKKYGKVNFFREVLFEFKTRNEALTKEKNLVTKELVADNNCYNLTIGGNSPKTLGLKRTPNVPIKSMDMLGNITYYDSPIDAQNKGAGNRKYICQAVTGRRITYNNLHWAKQADSFTVRKNKSESGCYSLDKYNNKVFYKSINLASRKTGVCSTVIGKCIRTNKGTGGGFNWFLSDSNVDKFTVCRAHIKKRCASIDSNGNLKIYNSLRDASRSLGLKCGNNISDAIKSGFLYHGFTWVFVEDNII